MISWDVVTENVERLEPDFRDDVTALLHSSSYDWRVVYAYRSLELQAELYERFKHGGPRAAPPGLSAHNYGLAVDIQLWLPDTEVGTCHGDRMEWNVKTPGWQWLFDAVRKSARLHSGIGFGDFDHIERYHWKQFRDWNIHGEG